MAERPILDDLDRQILDVLRADARRSFRAIAAATGSTVPTVSARVRRMESLDIIRGYTIILNDQLTEPAPPKGQPALPCHTCGQATAKPYWAHLSDRPHPFCCTTCRRMFVQQHERFSQQQRS